MRFGELWDIVYDNVMSYEQNKQWESQQKKQQHVNNKKKQKYSYFQAESAFHTYTIHISRRASGFQQRDMEREEWDETSDWFNESV